MSPSAPESAAATAAAAPVAEDPQQDAAERGERAAVSVRPVAFGPLDHDEAAAESQACAASSLDLLLDVEVPLVVELGHTQMTIEELLSLHPGAILELDKLASEPVDLLVRGHIVAHGEIIVVDDTFGVRISRIVDPAARIQGLGGAAG